MDYTEKIKAFIKVKGLNNRDLSNKLGKAEALVSRWVNADKPSLEFLITMAKKFPDFDLNYILREKVSYPILDDIEMQVSEKPEKYKSSAVDIIEEIERKLDILKQKVAQNSHN